MWKCSCQQQQQKHTEKTPREFKYSWANTVHIHYYYYIYCSKMISINYTIHWFDSMRYCCESMGKMEQANNCGVIISQLPCMYWTFFINYLPKKSNERSLHHELIFQKCKMTMTLDEFSWVGWSISLIRLDLMKLHIHIWYEFK